jgi:hypothetical protein
MGIPIPAKKSEVTKPLDCASAAEGFVKTARKGIQPNATEEYPRIAPHNMVLVPQKEFPR